jgi:predicted anti-sigma-YlaC factor YlaD
MDKKKLDHWINKIVTTEPEEISCSECFDRISEYVDDELDGKTMIASMRQVRHHINMCQVCREEYELIHDLAKETRRS